MNAPILVTGGTGTIGTRVVPLLRAAGRNVRVLSRHPRPNAAGIEYAEGDTVTGAGLQQALKGVDIVLHLAGGAKGDDVAARNLAEAASSAGASHLVLISVVGADRMPIGYFRAKAVAERSIVESGVPWTVVRAAQLHDFVLPLVKGLARVPLTPVPGGLRFEPVHVEEVAARLAELTLGDPAGRVADIAGPEVLDIPQLLATYTDFNGRRRPKLPIRLPGAIGRAYRAGENLTGPGAQRMMSSWAEFLAEQSAAAQTASSSVQG
ncbi:SDR family oxidoreductase [Arthrobacter sp. ISL-95]|uniref:SDR family oxidoreductase n=1 Tax=Arthrobacter sp. ISL-95 TaxID=2819116 RepID=UPI001BE88F80|nr:NAD(P)H-binding protein [Arthrobacter sp. ISL-95]MBT2586334.1 NAD(P)H-binding protein [Arthrobacter sp. ISL-95]